MSDQASQDYNSRLGIQLFCVYSAVYTAFVLVNAFAPQWADWIVFGGLNLAVVWGFALIVFAFVLALIYGTLCGNGSPHSSQSSEKPTEAGK